MKRLLMLIVLMPLSLFAADLVPIGWGVVTVVETPLYDKTGKQAGELYGGEIFTVLREVKMNKEPAYYIEFDRKGAQNGIIAAAGSRYFAGVLPTLQDNVDAYVEYISNQKLCKDYYSLCATRDRVLERKRAQHLEKSPAKNLEKLKKDLANVPTLDRRYEAAEKKARTNAERLKYRDLRKELRYQTTGLQQEIKRLEATADSWLKDHPFDENAVKRTAVWKKLDAQTEKFKAQMDALDAKYPNSLPVPVSPTAE